MGYKSISNRWFMFFAIALLLLPGATAHAALQSFAPTPATFNGAVIGGMPAWFQDQNGVSVEPCLDVVACGLAVGVPNFNSALPMVYPTNFPTEAFYFNATAIFNIGPAATPIDTLVVLALEFVFMDPVTGALITSPLPANAVSAAFQRQRMVLSYPPGAAVPTGGSFVLTHPWGTTTFPFALAKCVNNAGGQKCSMTQDLPIVGVPTNPAAALGTGVPGSMSTFLKDPLAPSGFLGSGLPVTSFVGAAAGSVNSITVTDPLGNTGTTAALSVLTGKVVGLTVAPSTVSFPVSRPAVTSAPVDVTITNPSTVNIAQIGASAVTGANAADFLVTPGTCTANAVLPAGGSCTFSVQFVEAAPGVNGTKSAIVSFPVVTPLNMPPVSVNLAGIIDNVQPTVLTTQPADGAVNWPANNRVHVTFSEPVTNVTATTTFTLTGPAGDVGGSITLDPTGTLADYAQPADLTQGATYTATLTAGITDIAGNPLVPKTFSFTAGAPDTHPPAVAATNPPHNAVDVQVTSPISATFSGTVDPNTVNATTFTLSDGVTGSVTFDAQNNKAIFTPSQPLEFFHAYTATIKGGTGGVVSLGQIPMAADYTWTFFTNGAPASPQLLSPGDGATGLGTSVDLQWMDVKDVDGEPVSYHVWYCTNPAFVGCSPVNVPATTAAGRLGGYGAGMLLAGFAVVGAVRSRRRLPLLVAAFAVTTVLVSGMLISSCSKKSDDAPAVPTVTKNISGLRTSTTYWWKVVADDGNGAQVDSATWKFSTQ